MLRAGDILEFKGQGILYRVLSWLLKRLEPNWNGWGWHMAFVSRVTEDEIQIMESTGDGCQLNPLPEGKSFKVYRWFDEPVDQRKLNLFVSSHLGKDYDAGCYFGTALQYLMLHFFNHRVPRLLDNRYTCWELVFEMAREMGKPIQEAAGYTMRRYPLLPDLLAVIQKDNIIVS